jgi:hypothetical protein
LYTNLSSNGKNVKIVGLNNVNLFIKKKSHQNFSAKMESSLLYLSTLNLLSIYVGPAPMGCRASDDINPQNFVSLKLKFWGLIIILRSYNNNYILPIFIKYHMFSKKKYIIIMLKTNNLNRDNSFKFFNIFY